MILDPGVDLDVTTAARGKATVAVSRDFWLFLKSLVIQRERETGRRYAIEDVLREKFPESRSK